MDETKDYDSIPEKPLSEFVDLKTARIISVGSGNFSAIFALAAFRGSWANLIATEKTTTNLVNSNNDKRRGVSVVRNLRKCFSVAGFGDEPIQLPEAESSNLLQRIWALLNLESPTPECFIPDSVDATDPDRLGSLRAGIKGTVFWFQCPWAYPGDTSDLLCNFLNAAAASQEEGDVVLLGLTKLDFYAKRYKFRESVAQHNSYTVVAKTLELTSLVTSYGYRHHTNATSDLDSQLAGHYVTIVLKRKHTLPLIEKLSIN